MPNVLENPEIFPPVPLIVPGTKVKGGDEEAPANVQAVALAARTAFLKAQLDSMETNGVYVIGTLTSQAELDNIDPAFLGKGDGYFVDGALCIWNGRVWVSSGSLVGKPGKDGVGGNEVSTDPGNALSLGEDGRLYVPNDLNTDLLSAYTTAKE